VTDLLVVDDLVFEIRRSGRRKTIGVSIDRDGSLIIAAPASCTSREIEETAGTKRLWVHKKLAERELLLRPAREKEYVDGEGFWYFGRSYRLLLREPTVNGNPIPALRLHQGRFQLRRDEVCRAREHFLRWYTENGLPWIVSRVSAFADRIGVQPNGAEIRDHGYRWGSCGRDGHLYFHWRTILLPPPVVEYVVVHELVHLREPNHQPSFWQRVERAMPDFAERKRWLAENGGKFY